MLLTAINHILSNGEAYDAELYKKSEKPPVSEKSALNKRFPSCKDRGMRLPLRRWADVISE
jgi:hypothetical protein